MSTQTGFPGTQKTGPNTSTNHDDSEEFSTPLSSPDSTTAANVESITDYLLTHSKKGATVELSDVSALTSDSKPVLKIADVNLAKNSTNMRSGKKFKGRVVFRDSELTETFDDKDLWIHNPGETAQDMLSAYQRECLTMKVKPIQILLDQLKGVYDLNTPIDSIDLTGVRLDSRTCEVLEAVFSRISTGTLKLERTSLEDEGVIALFEMVEFYGCATRLLLAHNNKLRPRAWLTIGRTLKKSPFITTIDVSYCGLDEQTLTLLLRAVRANCGLKVLKMEGNNLTGKGTFILMAAMKFNENLEELHLSRNHLAPEDGQHLGNILRSNHTLRVLDVSDNNLQDSGVRYISAGIAEQQEGLCVLNIGTNNLTHDGIHHVSAMLPCTKGLKELNISNNRFGDVGLFMLKLGVLANRSLERLILCGTKITCEGAIALAEVLAESRYLTHVDLRENEIRVAGLMALSLAMRMNHHLLYLETPKTFKVEQRDRQLIRDILVEMDKYRSRNHKEKEEKDREKARLMHEESHANKSVDKEETITGPSVTGKDNDDDEKEVDPSLIGSLDNVYTDETEAEMMKEDPFKKAPIIDKEHASSNEMEKTVNTLLVYTSENDTSDITSPLPEDNENELSGIDLNAGSLSAPPPNDPVDLLMSPVEIANDGNAPLLPVSTSSSTHELLPDLIGTSPPSGGLDRNLTTPPASTHSAPPPDVTPHGGNVPPDLAIEIQPPVDLLSDNNSSGVDPLDLTEGMSRVVIPDVSQ